MKKILMLLLAVLLLFSLVACNNGDAGNTEGTGDNPKGNIKVDNSETSIGMVTQEYIGDNIAEIPMITYDGSQSAFDEFNHKNPGIEPINMEIKNTFAQEYNDFDTDGDAWIEIKTYPFVDSKYVQIVITKNVFPNYATDGEVVSFNFDKDKNAAVTLEEIMKVQGLTLEKIESNVKELYKEAGDMGEITEVAVNGFMIMDEGLYTEYLLEVDIEHPDSDPEHRICLYSDNNGGGLVFYDGYYLFDPVTTSPLMDPPLKCQQSSGAFDSELSLTFDTNGLETIVPDMEYSLDGLVSYTVESYPHMDLTEENIKALLESVEMNVYRYYKVEWDDAIELSYPTMTAVYNSGENEDARHNVDLFVAVEGALLRFHSTVPLDYETEYHDDMGRRMYTVTLSY